MRAGRFIRLGAALDAADRVPCECGHAMSLHRELQPTLYRLDGDAVHTEPNPDYRPLHFHCQADGCTCILDRSEA